MKWCIPAKTFLVGEYIALKGEPAIILTTKPCFEVTLSRAHQTLTGIHPNSPGGVWWSKEGSAEYGLDWYDPYSSIGGLGASSAQFLGVYYATLWLQNKSFERECMLSAYHQSIQSQKGLQPSGYDVMAQSSEQCVYINQVQRTFASESWPFEEMTFVLLHTRQKLATHVHLEKLHLPKSLEPLTDWVEMAQLAFKEKNDNLLVNAVNGYAEALKNHHLVASHTLAYLEWLRSLPYIMATKGCGALGADVILCLLKTTDYPLFTSAIKSTSLQILASSEDLYDSDKKELEIPS